MQVIQFEERMHKEITSPVFRPHRLPDYLLASCLFCQLTIGEWQQREAAGPVGEWDHLGEWAEVDQRCATEVKETED